ncbi:hypothetical protein [Oligoflexus tunisiensis]|uniref:hypothetical protein n=1 Tax=Oligoflexus tunisiensis TaxID=708132 RepID=UPI00114D0F49|nr:hypothetical protein [Oligoflexus tunisiensis]
MLSRFPFLPGGLALLVTACAMPQTGLRRTMPIDHTVLRGDQLHTERQILEEREIKILSAFGNLNTVENRFLIVRLASALEAPVVEGRSLRVTRLVQDGTLLVVAYAGEGDRRHGVLALVDLADPEHPVLRAEVQLPSVAVQNVAIDGQQIYFVGTRAAPEGPVVGRLSIQDFEWRDDLKLQSLELPYVTALTVTQDKILVLDSQSSQLVTLQKKDLFVTGTIKVPGWTQLSQGSSTVWAFHKDPAALVAFDADLQMKTQILTSGSMDTAHPGTIHMGRETVMTALGDMGVRAFCQMDQKPLFHIPAVIRADLPRERSWTLETALSHGLLFTANDAAGVYLYQVATSDRDGACQERLLQLEGYLDAGKDFNAQTLHWEQEVLSVGDDQGRLYLFFIDTDKLESDDTDFDG